MILTVAMYLGFAALATGQETPNFLSQIQELRQALDNIDRQLELSRQESAQLRQELQALREQLDRDRATDVKEEQQLLNAKVEDQYQTKVESGSKYRVRLSGLALMNAFTTRGAVDNLDLPLFALPRPAGDSNGSVGASARQSRVNLDVFGPEWKGAKTHGDMSFDFFGGFPSASDGTPSGLVRLRTAKLSMDWANTSLTAGQDVPFFSPLSPTSIASSAYPPLASSGNLWTWAPQIHAEHRIALSDRNKFVVQGGVLDPFTGELPNEYDRIPTAGERSRGPAYATRMGWQHTAGDRAASAGIGSYYSRQNWSFGRTVDAWAATADWDLPLNKWLSFSGEFYRGRAMAGLGASASPSVVFSGSSVLALNNVGGWSQMKVKPVERIEFNAAFGQDQAFRPGLGNLLGRRAIDGSPLSRNASGFLNVIYQPRSNLLFSVEYRRLWTSGFYDPKRTADHVSVTSGIVF